MVTGNSRSVSWRGGQLQQCLASWGAIPLITRILTSPYLCCLPTLCAILPSHWLAPQNGDLGSLNKQWYSFYSRLKWSKQWMYSSFEELVWKKPTDGFSPKTVWKTERNCTCSTSLDKVERSMLADWMRQRAISNVCYIQAISLKHQS